MGHAFQPRRNPSRYDLVRQFAFGWLLAACVLAPALPQIPVAGADAQYAPALLETMTSATVAASVHQARLLVEVVLGFLWH